MDKEKYTEILEKGGLVVKAICELLGSPKEHIEKTMELLVKKARELKKTDILKAKVYETREQENSLFSSFVEFEILFHNMESLMGFCFDFMPSSVEIVEPEKISIESRILSSWINELQAKLHNVDMIAKKSSMLQKIVNRRFNTVVRTNILTHLMKQDLNREELARLVGIKEEGLKPYLELLKKKGEIKFENKKYRLAKPVQFKDDTKKSG
jgi:hypothetical protein